MFMSEVPLYEGSNPYADEPCGPVVGNPEGHRVDPFSGILLIRKRNPLGPYSRNIPRALQ